MILYFADRNMNILGQASTSLPEGLKVENDLKSIDVDTGTVTFECEIPYDGSSRDKVQSCTEAGNYLLRSSGEENEFYTVIDTEDDSKDQKTYIYAEDAGLDLLNEIVGAYEADQDYPISHYIEKFTYDSGFEIGINEVEDLSRKLSWEGEATASERVASVATQFDNAEISFSFDIKELAITNKYINIYRKRGQDTGIQLRLNKEVDRIITKKSVSNLCTALQCTGGTPEGEEDPITLQGYEYDDGDFYVSGSRLCSRDALKKWSRYIWAKEPNQVSGGEGHIVGTFSYDTTSQSELCNRAIAKLKLLRETEVNYEIDINRLPENVRIGDQVNVVDDAGGLYLAARILKLTVSVCNKTDKATLGEYLIKDSGISEKVQALSQQFAELAQKRAVKGEDATVIHIDSSRGTVFKNNSVSTVLSAVVYRGSKRITDLAALKTEYGSSAYLQWSWQRLGEDAFGTILSSDSRLSNGGFSFSLSPDDVDTKVTFLCQLITD